MTSDQQELLLEMLKCLTRATQKSQILLQDPSSLEREEGQDALDVWAIDFQFDQTMDGRRLKLLNIVDEYSRMCLAIRVGRRCD